MRRISLVAPSCVARRVGTADAVKTDEMLKDPVLEPRLKKHRIHQLIVIGLIAHRRAADRRLCDRPGGRRVAAAGHSCDPRPRAARGVAGHHPAVPHILRDLYRRTESPSWPDHDSAPAGRGGAHTFLKTSELIASAATLMGIQKGHSSMKTNRLFVAAVVVTAVAAPIAGFGEDMKVPLREWNRCVSSQH